VLCALAPAAAGDRREERLFAGTLDVNPRPI